MLGRPGCILRLAGTMLGGDPQAPGLMEEMN
jgi:hypothetical protein